jgi:formylglycine-generating enzyme required for sulfatase activity
MRALTFVSIAVFGGCAPATSARLATPQMIDRAACERDERFVFVPSGPFVFGSTHEERDAAYRMAAESSARTPDEIARTETLLRQRRFFDFEPDRTTITAAAYCIERHPVTQREYAEFVRATGHRAPAMDEATWRAQGFLVHPFDEVRAYLWNDNAPPQGSDDWPVVLVSVDDANAYARWRGERDRRVYALPTREEWERASRGTDGRLYPWGNDWRVDAIHFGPTGIAHPTPVGSYPLARGPSGADDMLGNVFEWTATGDATRHAIKGCAFDDLAGFCRSAYEHRRASTSRHILVGFRLVWRGERR